MWLLNTLRVLMFYTNVWMNAPCTTSEWNSFSTIKQPWRPAARQRQEFRQITMAEAVVATCTENRTENTTSFIRDLKKKKKRLTCSQCHYHKKHSHSKKEKKKSKQKQSHQFHKVCSKNQTFSAPAIKSMKFWSDNLITHLHITSHCSHITTVCLAMLQGWMKYQDSASLFTV